MTELDPTVQLATLNDLLSVCKKNYDDCVDTVTHQQAIRGVTATTRLHHLKFDGNGQPLITALAEYLYEHIIGYCIAARNRPETLSLLNATRLTKEAKELFRNPIATNDDPDETGEAGEMLLYFLMEAVLGAPQVVAKMELKTNKAMEIHGSDGIHMACNPIDSMVDVYFGEAKLYQDIGAAMTSAFKSIEAFHTADMCRHEFKMVTKHFKHADLSVQTAVTDLLRDGVPTQNVRVNHALLIGYNWDGFNGLPQQPVRKLVAEFQARYVADAPRLHELLQKRFESFAHKHLRFEVFFLPFTKVQDFRDAFNKALK